MEGTMAEIRLFAGNFAPRNWGFCSGQLIAISQNSALFSLLGTTYGGDGRTTFALPDLRGRTAIGQGTGPGLSNRPLGQRSGVEVNFLTSNQLPAHTHPITQNISGTPAFTGTVSPKASSSDGDADTPVGNYTAVYTAKSGSEDFATAANATTTMASSPVMMSGSVAITGAVTLGNSGASQAIANRSPYLGMYYIICMFGVFPSRS